MELEWARAPIVAVGDVTNITSYGEQPVEGLPWPGSVGVHRLYWCEGDFQATATLKGELHAAVTKFLWAYPSPGCEIYTRDRNLIASRFETRVWFLREEGSFLRPLFDGGGAHRFVGFCAKWVDGAPLPVRQRVGMFLLTPSANCTTPEDYARYLWSVGDFACALLGKRECVQRMRALARSGNTPLRTAACEYLNAQQHTSCK
jgi:hypothetical protein